MTLGLLRALQKLGIRCPEKVTVMGFVDFVVGADGFSWGEIIPPLEPREVWVVVETGWVKQGSHSVGAAHQYGGAVGKRAHGQVRMEVGVSDRGIAAPQVPWTLLHAQDFNSQGFCNPGIPSKFINEDGRKFRIFLGGL